MTDNDAVHFAKAVSRVLGWLYFLAWSGSFYPQPIMNWKRKSTMGLAIDFPVCNVLGFVAYTISTAAFLYSPSIRDQYAYRHPHSPEPTVRFNDFLFAAHGAVLCILTYTMFYPAIWGFKVGAMQRASKPILGIFWGSILGLIIVTFIIRAKGRDFGQDASGWAWIDLIYAFGYVKVLVTLVKYMPQVWQNYKRKSTEGWSINQILLDFAGGIFSLAQLIIDASLQADWSGLTGNPVKFGLSNISMMFDIIFIFQHYVIYRNSGHGYEQITDDEETGVPDRPTVQINRL